MKVNVRDAGSVPGLERSPGGGNSNALQYSGLENPMDRGACWATVHGVAKSQTRLKWLSTHACMQVGLSPAHTYPPLPSWAGTRDTALTWKSSERGWWMVRITMRSLRASSARTTTIWFAVMQSRPVVGSSNSMTSAGKERPNIWVTAKPALCALDSESGIVPYWAVLSHPNKCSQSPRENNWSGRAQLPASEHISASILAGNKAATRSGLLHGTMDRFGSIWGTLTGNKGWRAGTKVFLKGWKEAG